MGVPHRYGPAQNGVVVHDGRNLGGRRVNANGVRRLWWVLGVLVPVGLLAGAATSRAILDHESRISGNTKMVESGEKRLERIEDKLDRVLERMP